MLDKLINSKLSRSDHAIGIEVLINSDGAYIIDAVKLILNKGSLETNKIISDAKTIDDIASLVKYDTPVIVTFKGKGIINKKIKKDEHSDNKNIIGKILPNASEKDFYLQVITINDEYLNVTIVRKKLIDGIINLFAQKKIYLYDIRLNYFYLNNIASIISLPENIQIDDDLLIIKNNCLDEIKTTNSKIGSEKINVGGEEVSLNILNSFSAAFSYFFTSNDYGYLSEEFAQKKEEFVFKVLIKKLGMGVMGFIFILLMVNYFIYSSNKSQVDINYSRLQQNNGLLLKIDSLRKTLDLKNMLIKESGFDYYFSFSNLADKIAYLKPAGIILTEIQIQPLTDNISSEEKYIFKLKVIEISGKTKNSYLMNDWLKKLKSEEWVKDIKILDYIHDTKENIGNFKMGITIK